MHDAIVVGARCAGAPTAMLLARKARIDDPFAIFWRGRETRCRRSHPILNATL